MKRNPAIIPAAILSYIGGLEHSQLFPLDCCSLSRIVSFLYFRNQIIGRGFIERLGLNSMIAARILFMVVSGFEIVAGTWLWRSLEIGGKLAPILTLVGAVF